MKYGIMVVSAALATACAPTAPQEPVSGVVETTFLTDDLLAASVEIGETADVETVRRLTDCAAAEAALLREFDFMRHVRTVRAERGGVYRADAVYTVSKALPQGSAVIDAAVVVQDCNEQGRPGV